VAHKSERQNKEQADPVRKIMCVAGARPNFMKIGPIIHALHATRGVVPMLVHTGQHYDPGMNDVFFAELQIPRPDRSLNVGSGSHAVQTAQVMLAIEPVIEETRPDIVVVVGDVNSTLAATLVAVKLGVAVAHVEAGLRSFDRSMPEEINRLLTDQIATLLFTTERSAEANLRREGIPVERVHFVGNVMIDSLRGCLPRAVPARETFAAAGRPDLAEVAPGFALLTLHRPANVDDPDTLADLLETIREVSELLPVAFPVHPRTARRIADAGLEALFHQSRIVRLEPVGYLAALGLMREARVVLTDSGGVQEETTGLGVPCLTLRANTERPITIEEGTNELVGRDRELILAKTRDILATGGKSGRVPELWDGRAAERIAARLAQTPL
jgi:UDP-N-acetylglucosamine 2-epimerase (non-hydrolysing)